MKQSIQKFSTVISALTLALALTACSDKPQEHAGQTADEVVSKVASAPNGEPTDVVARVGDQVITFSQINTMLNSSAVVGVSIPALGSPERDTVRITLLDKIVSANLLYLDALKQGLDQDTAYQQELQKFRGSILTGIYRDRYLKDATEITDEEIEAYYQTTEKSDAELTNDVRAAIVAILRKQKLEERSAELRTGLREGVTVQLNDNEMDPLRDAERADTAVLAYIDDAPITWGEVRPVL